MKCIKCIRQTKTYDLGEIRRTDDIDAEQKVKSGTFKYIPKTEWKGNKENIKVEKPKKEKIKKVKIQDVLNQLEQLKEDLQK